MSKFFVITLDGPAGSGKSTLAKKLSSVLGFKQIDSGAIYRTYTYYALKYCSEKNKSLHQISNSKELFSFLSSVKLKISFKENRQQIKVNNIDMEPLIRTSYITSSIVYLADNLQVRELVNIAIRQISKSYSIIADGRDMGTEVFFAADLKFYIDADLQERIKRRAKEMKEKDLEFNIETLAQQIEQRDRQDRNRKVGGLKIPNDAIFIDTTTQSFDVAFQSVLKIVKSKLGI